MSRSRTVWPNRCSSSRREHDRSSGRGRGGVPRRAGQPLCLDDGKLVVAHAGMKEEMQGRGSGKVRDFALYGETTGETDEFGLPVRYNWAAEYRGKAMVVYGHTPVPEPEWLNRTINIDTGCVFGGKLTALRYPEKELVSVPATADLLRTGASRFCRQNDQAPALTAQQQHDDLLDIEDVLGKRIIATRLHHNVTIREENATAALEVMSRFAANPKWLIYLPPTMSPSETSKQARAVWSIRRRRSPITAHEGVPQVVCEEKHMGSRAVVIVCRDEEAARQAVRRRRRRASASATRGRGGGSSLMATLERQILERVRAAVDAAGFWDEFETDWVCLDCELMPWSAKAQELLRRQYAPYGRGCDVRALAGGYRRPADAAADAWRSRGERLVGAYRAASIGDRQLMSTPTGATAGRWIRSTI